MIILVLISVFFLFLNFLRNLKSSVCGFRLVSVSVSCRVSYIALYGICFQLAHRKSGAATVICSCSGDFKAISGCLTLPVRTWRVKLDSATSFRRLSKESQRIIGNATESMVTSRSVVENLKANRWKSLEDLLKLRWESERIKKNRKESLVWWPSRGLFFFRVAEPRWWEHEKMAIDGFSKLDASLNASIDSVKGCWTWFENRWNFLSGVLG